MCPRQHVTSAFFVVERTVVSIKVVGWGLRASYRPREDTDIGTTELALREGKGEEPHQGPKSI